jgi:hypothetical protein
MAKKAKKAKAKKAKAASAPAASWVNSLSPEQIRDLNRLRRLFPKKPKCQRLNIVSAGANRWDVSFKE